ncbi:MAP3K7 C-terminal-like protein [Trichomycterus rosablanca]|uniref:MAP3K7 C-terminal-like protein n=1 Tax=Trichomycterus rosablanca TaxID=2290929 RepID=UPI002F360DE2
MITSARRLAKDKPEVQISFSLDESSELNPAEDEYPSFPNLEQRLQPVLPCQSLKESVQIYREHCKMAKEFHQVKNEIALLEDRKRELIAELAEDESATLEIAGLEEEFHLLVEENQSLVTMYTECTQQLATLRIVNQKRQGSS